MPMMPPPQEFASPGGSSVNKMDEIEAFLEQHDLQPFAYALQDFGIEDIADLHSLSDEDLRDSIFMTDAEIEEFRAILAAQQSHPEAPES